MFLIRSARVRRWSDYAWGLAAVALCTALGVATSPLFELVNIAMVYLLAVVVVALRFSRGPAVATSVMSVAAFDFFFVPPQLTLAVTDMQYLVTFSIMLVVALVISTLVDIVRRAESEYVRSTLLASISHDLRTPLAVISGASSALAARSERLSPAEREALAHSIYRHAHDMAELVTNVLQMTRLECGGIDMRSDWVALGELVGSALRRLHERLAAHRVEVDLAEHLPLVRADATLIEQVLGNLLENTAKHTPAGTRVTLRAVVRDAEVLVSVEDDGPGLPPGAAEYLFAMFERGESEGTVSGIGLGLSICRAIVRLHGGRIWVERLSGRGASHPPGRGTAFRFTLPLAPSPTLPADAARPAEPLAG
jgi:two-component system sensor histidine kinase KdpD